MIEVRIRHEFDGDSARLGRVPLEDASLAGVLNLVKRWGLSVDGEDYSDRELWGQFVLNDHGAAYFEVVVSE